MHRGVTESVGRVASLRRYPVKSLVGEELERILVEERGLVGDRWWAVRDADGKLGSGKSTRRFRRMDGLLSLQAHYEAEVPVVAFPDGRRLHGDDPRVHEALSSYVGRPVRLTREGTVSHFDEGPVHLVTSSSLDVLQEAGAEVVDPRRLRPNLVVSTHAPGLVEDGWVGRRLRIGDQLVLTVQGSMPRCVMVNLPQVGLPADGSLLHRITDLNQGGLGVVADVVSPGPAAVGDPVVLS